MRIVRTLITLTAVLLLVAGLTACNTAPTSTATTLTPTTPVSTTTFSTITPAIPQYRPIEVVRVTRPVQLINPGGPELEITLKNNGAEPVVHLAAVFKMLESYDFSFNVTASAPLINGQTITGKQTLIGPGSFISYEAWYSLKISAILQSGSVIEYTVHVKIDWPTAVPTLTVK